MKIDLDIVKKITHETIQRIYPYYYPKGAVDFFIQHHSVENISADIALNNVFIIDVNEIPVGTVTINGNEISRLFVLPKYQRKGYGKLLLDFSEKQISQEYKKIQLASSLPAKELYLKLGYKEIEFRSILTMNNDYLCYDVMEK